MTDDNGPRITFAMIILGVVLAFAGISEISFGLTKIYLARNIPHTTRLESPGPAVVIPLTAPATEPRTQTNTTDQAPSPGSAPSSTERAPQ